MIGKVLIPCLLGIAAVMAQPADPFRGSNLGLERRQDVEDTPDDDGDDGDDDRSNSTNSTNDPTPTPSPLPQAGPNQTTRGQIPLPPYDTLVRNYADGGLELRQDARVAPRAKRLQQAISWFSYQPASRDQTDPIKSTIPGNCTVYYPDPNTPETLNEPDRARVSICLAPQSQWNQASEGFRGGWSVNTPFGYDEVAENLQLILDRANNDDDFVGGKKVIRGPVFAWVDRANLSLPFGSEIPYPGYPEDSPLDVTTDINIAPRFAALGYMQRWLRFIDSRDADFARRNPIKNETPGSCKVWFPPNNNVDRGARLSICAPQNLRDVNSTTQDLQYTVVASAIATIQEECATRDPNSEDNRCGGQAKIGQTEMSILIDRIDMVPDNYTATWNGTWTNTTQENRNQTETANLEDQNRNGTVPATGGNTTTAGNDTNTNPEQASNAQNGTEQQQQMNLLPVNNLNANETANDQNKTETATTEDNNGPVDLPGQGGA
ncbi:MAG: hypothetical protein M1831_004735 [Alyxoria varia]|nr:MAG: hypothetical protein M1831_004735 [Alyxoria varia]